MSDGNPQSGSRTVLVALGIAVLFGVAVAGGSVFTGAGTEASTGDALPYAALGAAVMMALTGIAYAIFRQASPESPRLGLGQLLGAVFIAAMLGALVGTALTPRSPTVDEVSSLDDGEIERRAETLGDLADGTVVRPIDFDGDGLPDLDANGDPILAYDEDGDGAIDGYLQPCPERTATVAFETSMAPHPFASAAPLDVECDGEVDKYLEFDDTPFTAPVEALPPPVEPPTTIAPEELEERARDQSSDAQFGSILRNVLIGLAILAIVIALAAAVIRWRRDDADEVDLPTAPAPSDVERPIARTIDAMVRDVDPRQAIIEAYGTLLAELAAIGLPRRPEEAPAEHIARCLQRADLDEASVTQLIELFTLARFSTHPVTEQHRLAAIRCLRSSVRQDLVSSGSWPPPPGAEA